MFSKQHFFYLFCLVWLVLSQTIGFSFISEVFKNFILKSFAASYETSSLPTDTIRFLRRRLQEVEQPTPAPFYDFTFTFAPSPQQNNQNAVNSSGKGVNGIGPTASENVSSSNEIVPAVMVAVASSVILCAAILYAADLRDRFRHERMIQEHRRRRDNDTSSSKQMETIASSGGYWIRASADRTMHHHHLDNNNLDRMEEHDPEMMHHHRPHDQPEYVEEHSISQVSTMTASIAPLEIALQRVDSEGLEASLDITELSESHRVSLDTDLASLVDLSRIQAVENLGGDDNSTQIKINTYESGEEDHYGNGLSFPFIGDIDYVMKEEDDDEENESGWTSSAGKSDTSSEVSIGTYLKSIQSSKSHGSSSSSNAGKSRASSTNSQKLYGVKCLEDTPQKGTNSDASLERSPDTPHSFEDRGSGTENEMTQLEHLYPKGRLPIQEYAGSLSPERSTISDDDTSAGQDYVRDVYFLPVATTSPQRMVDLGISLSDAVSNDTYPMVISVSKDSPLVDRIFVGDAILAVNDEWTAGRDALDVTKKFWGEKEPDKVDVVKFTIMSCVADGSDDESYGSTIPESIDTGDADTAIEV